MSDWIRVKDRLPEKPGYYICTARWKNESDYSTAILDYGNDIASGIPDWMKKNVFPNGYCFGERWPDGIDNIHDVIAWMEIPDAYKE